MKYLIICLLFLPLVSAHNEIILDNNPLIFNNEIIHSEFIINNNGNLTINNSVILSNNFLRINCDEELGECRNVSLNISVTNSYIYTDFVIYSDEINTANIFIDNNWYYDYNKIDHLYVWEHNHDIIDYNPKDYFVKRKVLNKHYFKINI